MKLSSKLLIIPSGDVWWTEMAVGPSYFQHIGDNQIEAYLTGRDKEGVSRIGKGYLQIERNGEISVKYIEREPIFNIGEEGCFDESGVSYPWIIIEGNSTYMYYVGWVKGGVNGFQNFLGLAVREEGHNNFKRVKKVPILDRSDQEPYGTGSCCVTRESEGWRMIYTSFLEWEGERKRTDTHPNRQPSYNLKTAYSEDLINWRRDYQAILPFKENEHIQGKPVLTQDRNNSKTLFFSSRGDHYRISCAIGPDIKKLTRMPDLDFEYSEWISETQEYAFPLEVGDSTYLFFNGNGYGRTGLGYTKLN